jgi:osmotically-inducible protein OsmY
MLDVDAVDESNIRLAGSVNSFYSRQLAVAAAKHVAGVRHVIDDISVIDRTSSD